LMAMHFTNEIEKSLWICSMRKRIEAFANVNNTGGDEAMRNEEKSGKSKKNESNIKDTVINTNVGDIKLENNIERQNDNPSISLIQNNVDAKNTATNHDNQVTVENKLVKSKINQCQLCYFTLNQAGNLKRHQQRRHQEDREWLGKEITENDLKYKCDFCHFRFISNNLVAQHIKRSHDQLQSVSKKKSLSIKKINSKISLQSKVSVKLQIKKISCKLCDMKFSRRSYLNHHIDKNHEKDKHWLDKDFSESNLKYKCYLCKIKFTTQDILVQHVKAGHKGRSKIKDAKKRKVDTFKRKIGNLLTQYSCNHCSNSFLTQNSLDDHKLTEHDKSVNKEPETCTYCSKVFLWSSNRQKKIQCHINRAHRTPEDTEKKVSKVVTCKLCYREYRGCAGKFNLQKHQVRDHPNDLQFLNKDLTTRSNLRFDCTQCNLKFVSNNILVYHTAFQHKEDM